MKLGLSLSLGSGAKIQTVVPSDITGIQYWYKYMEGLTDESGNTDASAFVNSVKIDTWASQVGSNTLVNPTGGAYNKPLWSTAQNACNFNGNKHFKFTSTVNYASDFSVCMSVRFKNVPVDEGLLGGTSHNMLEMSSEDTIGFRAGGATEISMTNATYDVPEDKFVTIIIVRSSGTVTSYINSDTNNVIPRVTWGSGTDSDTAVLDFVASWNVGDHELDGFIRDFSTYTTALTEAERAQLFTYTENLG